MPRYYCDYCDTYLTHDSPSVRKQHNAGYKHKANVRSYYQQFEEQQTQSLIDQRIREHLGQTAAFQQQVGVPFLASLQSNPQRPRLPILPPPGMPITAASQGPINSQGLPAFRPPVLPRPMTSAAGYGVAPTAPSMVGPPGMPSLPMQTGGLPRPPTLSAPPPAVSGGLPTGAPGMYQQPNPAAATSGGFDSFNISARATAPSIVGGISTAATGSQDGFTYAQPSEANH